MKKILVSVFSLYLVFCGSFMLFESDDLFAAVDEDQLQVILTVGSDITISAPNDCVLAPNMSSLADSTADCYAEWTIITGATLGFTATLTATTTTSNSEAWILKGNRQGDGFENYNWDNNNYSTTTEYTWGVSSGAEFGFKATSTTAADLVTMWKDSGSVCSSGSGMTNDVCWIGASSTAINLMNRASQAMTGTKLYIHFRAEKDTHSILQDTYTATTTITATTNG